MNQGHKGLVADLFPGMTSRISGIGIYGIEKKLENYTLKQTKKI